VTEPARDRHFLSLADWSRERLERIFRVAARVRDRGRDPAYRPLRGRTLAMIFMKSSTRTRVSFEAGTFQLGGHALFLSARDIQLGRGEPIRDTARVLSGYVDAVMIRTFAQSDVEELARHATIPVVNGLTDRLHPCQVLADLFTVREEFGSLEGIRVAWIGDGNNMAHSWLQAARRFGIELRLACPEGYEPDAEILDHARAEGRVRLMHDRREAAAGADVVTTDVWASMGQEDESERRRRDLSEHYVDGQLMRDAAEDAIFLHCLPAHRGEEVTAEVIDGPRSRVWVEAENRLHVQKALLLDLLDASPPEPRERGTHDPERAPEETESR